MGQTTSAENSREAAFGNNENNITTLCDLIAALSVSDEKKYKAPSHFSRNVAAKTTSEDKSPLSHRPYIDSTSETVKTTSIEREYTDSSPYVSYNAVAKTSFEENTSPISYRSYFNSSPELIEATSKENEKEYTTTPLPYRTYIDSTSELMKTSSEEKDNTDSFLRRPYISRKAVYIEQKIQKVPLKSYESQISHYVKKKYIDEIVTEIVRYLSKKDNYEVYGYWICKSGQCIHRPKCQDKLCRYENKCSEIELLYTRELLEKYLETPEKLCDLFRQNCMKCGRQNMLISSFRLYMKEFFNKNLITEIICHLEWENHYRVFGSWKCSHCRKRWKSAYTWISLRKFLEKTPGMFLNKEDYIMQKCKRCEGCRRCNNDKNIIFSYEPLVLSRDGADHKMELCAKCNFYGVKCIELETYYGMKHG